MIGVSTDIFLFFICFYMHTFLLLFFSFLFVYRVYDFHNNNSCHIRAAVTGSYLRRECSSMSDAGQVFASRCGPGTPQRQRRRL